MLQALKTQLLDDDIASADGVGVRRHETLLKTGALQNATLNSASFSSITTDGKGVSQIFNVGAERMQGYSAAEVLNKITPADISDPQEVIARAKDLSSQLQTLQPLQVLQVLQARDTRLFHALNSD